MTLTRRNILAGMACALATPFRRVAWAGSMGVMQERDPQEVFPCSIASGDPHPQGAVLWTRLAPEWVVDTREELILEIADEPGFQRGLRRISVAGQELTAARDFTVKIDLTEDPSLALEPSTRYAYRFRYRGVSSRIGFFKTLPEAEDEVQRLRFAFMSCQDYSSGYYNAFSELAREDLDFVLHLGDFIYEYRRYPGLDRWVRELPLAGDVALSLEDFRLIYRTYRQDPQLQRAMEQHTWILIPDDHETANDLYWDFTRDDVGLDADHPLAGASREERIQFRLAAQRAWSEYIPARVRFEEQALHPSQALRCYRSFALGSLGAIFVTDTRTYRTQKPSDTKVAAEAPDYKKPQGTLLGKEQRSWLVDGLVSIRGPWKIWANQTLMAQFGIRDPLHDRPLTVFTGLDGWDGYSGERKQIFQELSDRGASPFLVLTGDIHTYMASHLLVDFNRPWGGGDKNRVGFELVTPSISSPSFARGLALSGGESKGKRSFLQKFYNFIGDNYTRAPWVEKIFDHKLKKLNPHFTDFGAIYYGYMVVELEADFCTWWLYHSDPAVPPEQFVGKELVRCQRYWPAEAKVESLDLKPPP